MIFVTCAQHLSVCESPQQTCLTDFLVFFVFFNGLLDKTLADVFMIAQSVYFCCIQKLEIYSIVYTDAHLEH